MNTSLMDSQMIPRLPLDEEPVPPLAKLFVGTQGLVLSEPAMLEVYERLRRCVAVRLPLLLCGESGTGKLTAAQVVHALSPQSGRVFVSLNCAALGPDAARGFDQALRDAQGGTLYLDEVSALPLPLQAQLFWLLEERDPPTDGVTPRLDAGRVICSTQRALKDELLAGRFRSDLYYTLLGTQLFLPPLRERPRELPLLASQLLEVACRRLARGVMTVAPEVLPFLRRHPWPGNLRELRSVMLYVAATASDSELLPHHLPDEITRVPGGDGKAPPVGKEAKLEAFQPLAEEVRTLERRRMEEALEVAGGVQSHAAILLSMPDKTFREKVKEYGLRPPPRHNRRFN